MYGEMTMSHFLCNTTLHKEKVLFTKKTFVKFGNLELLVTHNHLDIMLIIHNENNDIMKSVEIILA